MSEMYALPCEIIETILKDKTLSIKDVVNVSSTCQLYRILIPASNTVWKEKFRQRWPELEDLFSDRFEYYYDEVRYIHRVFKRTQAMLESMPSRFCKKYEISESELEEWTAFLNEKSQNYWYLVSYLMDIVNTHTPIDTVEVVPLSTPGNKTLQYYSGKVLRHIRQLHLAKEWGIFRSLPPMEQLLESGAVFVAQWCQPNIPVSEKQVGLVLDDIANRVKAQLKRMFPDHRLFETPPDQFRKWKKYILDKNQWTPAECRQIMAAMKDVIYGEMEFSGNNVAYYMPQNSFINEVLENKQGLPITLAIIFEAVARRLGLRCEPISFPAHFLLRFNEDGKKWYYIDVFNSGNVIKPGFCPHSRADRDANDMQKIYPVSSAVQVVERMANNLEVSARQHTQVNGRVTRLRSSLELLKLVSPHDISALVSLARLYMLHNMDTKPLERFLLQQEFEVPEQAQRVVHMLRDYETHHSRANAEQGTPVEAARRTPELKYAVGMVMTHLALDYKCVIYDWDLECLASDEWQTQMHVQLLSLGAKQPFYNVLVEDGSHRYVAQENLQPTSDTGFLYLNDDVGRHFSHFCHTHYVPNADKEKEYPQDRPIRLVFHHELLSHLIDANSYSQRD